MPWIKTISPDESEGKLAELYVDIRKQSGGPLANIHKIRSLNPTVLEVQLALYRVLMFGPSELSRAQRELIATVVSATNHCPY